MFNLLQRSLITKEALEKVHIQAHVPVYAYIHMWYGFIILYICMYMYTNQILTYNDPPFKENLMSNYRGECVKIQRTTNLRTFVYLFVCICMLTNRTNHRSVHSLSDCSLKDECRSCAEKTNLPKSMIILRTLSTDNPPSSFVPFESQNQLLCPNDPTFR